MSIFDMFKKIFSSGSDDSFAETKSLEEISKEQATIKPLDLDYQSCCR